MTPSIVLLGNLLVDDVVFVDGATRMGQAGGAILYGALGAALWGARPGLVSLIGDDYPAEVLEKLQDLGVDVSGVHALGRPGVRTWLLYEAQGRRLIHWLGCPTHEEVSPRPAHIPTAWHDAPAFHIAPMPFDVQRALLTWLRGPGRRFVSIDPHLAVTEETLHDWKEALADADAFFPGEDELLLEGAQTNPHEALPRLVSVACASLSSSAEPAAGFSMTRGRNASTPGGRARAPRSIRPAPATPSRLASSVRMSKDFRSRPACNVPLSPRASPSTRGDPMR